MRPIYEIILSRVSQPNPPDDITFRKVTPQEYREFCTNARIHHSVASQFKGRDSWVHYSLGGGRISLELLSEPDVAADLLERYETS